MELLIDGGQDEGRPGVVPHQRGQLEDAAPAEELDARANVPERSLRVRNSSRPKPTISASFFPSPAIVDRA